MPANNQKRINIKAVIDCFINQPYRCAMLYPGLFMNARAKVQGCEVVSVLSSTTRHALPGVDPFVVVTLGDLAAAYRREFCRRYPPEPQLIESIPGRKARNSRWDSGSCSQINALTQPCDSVYG